MHRVSVTHAHAIAPSAATHASPRRTPATGGRHMPHSASAAASDRRSAECSRSRRRPDSGCTSLLRSSALKCFWTYLFARCETAHRSRRRFASKSTIPQPIAHWPVLVKANPRRSSGTLRSSHSALYSVHSTSNQNVYGLVSVIESTSQHSIFRHSGIRG